MDEQEALSEPEFAPDTDPEADLLEYVERIQALDPEAEEYYTNGEFRDTSALTSEEKEFMQGLIDAHGFAVKQCYHNSQLAVITYPDDLTYVEGYTLSPEVPVPVQHAWVELNGKVVELTFPERPNTRKNAAYFGTAYDFETVQKQVEAMERAFPLANQRAKATRGDGA